MLSIGSPSLRYIRGSWNLSLEFPSRCSRKWAPSANILFFAPTIPCNAPRKKNISKVASCQNCYDALIYAQALPSLPFYGLVWTLKLSVIYGCNIFHFGLMSTENRSTKECLWGLLQSIVATWYLQVTLSTSSTGTKYMHDTYMIHTGWLSSNLPLLPTGWFPN